MLISFLFEMAFTHLIFRNEMGDLASVLLHNTRKKKKEINFRKILFFSLIPFWKFDRFPNVHLYFFLFLEY